MPSEAAPSKYEPAVLVNAWADLPKVEQEKFITVLEPKVGQREYEDKEQALELNKEVVKRTLRALESFGEVWPVDAIEKAIQTYYDALDVTLNPETQSDVGIDGTGSLKSADPSLAHNQASALKSMVQEAVRQAKKSPRTRKGREWMQELKDQVGEKLLAKKFQRKMQKGAGTEMDEADTLPLEAGEQTCFLSRCMQSGEAAAASTADTMQTEAPVSTEASRKGGGAVMSMQSGAAEEDGLEGKAKPLPQVPCASGSKSESLGAQAKSAETPTAVVPEEDVILISPSSQAGAKAQASGREGAPKDGGGGARGAAREAPKEVVQNTAGCAAAESSGPGPEADYRAAFNGDLDSDEEINGPARPPDPQQEPPSTSTAGEPEMRMSIAEEGKRDPQPSEDLATLQDADANKAGAGAEALAQTKKRKDPKESTVQFGSYRPGVLQEAFTKFRAKGKEMGMPHKEVLAMWKVSKIRAAILQDVPDNVKKERRF